MSFGIPLGTQARCLKPPGSSSGCYKKTGIDMLDQQAILNALLTVMDPELHKDIVTLNMVKDIQISDGNVSLTVTLTTPACPLKETVEKDVRNALAKLGGVRAVAVNFDASVPR